MAQLPEVFSMKDAESSEIAGYPEDWYKVIIAGTKLKRTANKQGMYIQVSFKFLEGNYQDNILFNNYNIINTNDTAVRIAKKNLRAICESIGIDYENFEDTEELHDGELQIYIKSSGNEAFPNSITMYRPIDSEDDGDSKSQESSIDIF